ncbi:hypothetical protein EDB89DRAFT_1991194 [Lactarius sanguifluus]|nr:hypothetical protein EDB89DRAFT_1991194 [Lactarius sanguifluus]
MQSYVVCLFGLVCSSYWRGLVLSSEILSTSTSKYFLNAILSALILNLFFVLSLVASRTRTTKSVAVAQKERHHRAKQIAPYCSQTALRLRRFPFSKHKIDAVGSEIRFSFRTIKKTMIVPAGEGEGANVEGLRSGVTLPCLLLLPPHLLAEDDTRAPGDVS